MLKNVWIKAAAIAAVGLGSAAGWSAWAAEATAGAAGSPAGEWPRWLGPNGDGISREQIGDKWPADGPKKLWSAKVGIGFSSIAALDGKVYAFGTLDGKDVLTCFEADTGKVVWTEAYAGAYAKDYPGTRATPTIDGDKIYTYGGAGQLVARDLATGKQLWTLGVLEETGTSLLQWGQASSPLVYKDTVIVQAGDGNGPVAIAVEKATGKPAWKADVKMKGGYAHPIVIDVEGTPQLIVFAGPGPVALDPATGKLIWKQEWKTSYDVNAATPVYDGKKNLYISSGYGVGGAMFELTPTAAKRVWAKKDVKCKFQPPILDGGFVYAVSDEARGVIKCMKWPGGEIAWTLKDAKMGAGGAIVRVGDKLIAQTQTGELFLIKATPEAGKVLSSFPAFEGQSDQIWSMPVVYKGKLYAKGKDELACYDLK